MIKGRYENSIIFQRWPLVTLFSFCCLISSMAQVTRGSRCAAEKAVEVAWEAFRKLTVIYY